MRITAQFRIKELLLFSHCLIFKRPVSQSQWNTRRRFCSPTERGLKERAIRRDLYTVCHMGDQKLLPHLCQMQLCPPCNTVRSGLPCTCNRVRGYACMSMHGTYVYAAWTNTYFMIAANTKRPNISHVIHDMHLACKKRLLQGRFCTGADTTAYANVRRSVRADMIAYAKPSGGHYCICNNVLRIVLHRGHNCMRHRPYWRCRLSACINRSTCVAAHAVSELAATVTSHGSSCYGCCYRTSYIQSWWRSDPVIASSVSPIQTRSKQPSATAVCRRFGRYSID